jgi:hypothetical protein
MSTQEEIDLAIEALNELDNPKFYQQTGYIYCIKHESDPETFYIGSTAQSLQARLEGHFDECKRRPENKSKWFTFIRDKQYKGFSISALEQLKFADKQELTTREQAYLDQFKPALNTQAAFLSKEKARLRARQDDKKHYEKHKQTILEKKKAHREQNKDRFQCHACQYNTEAKSKYDKHCNTKKHKMNTSLPVEVLSTV